MFNSALGAGTRSHPVRRALAAIALAGCCSSAWPLDLQGHRGARGLAPENSLAGFELAIQLGVSRLELDTAITRDGVVVIHHDLNPNPAYARGPDGRWLEGPTPPIHAMRWAELQQLDIGRLRPGSDYARQFPDQKPADGTRIPRLADLFEWVKRKGHDHVHFAIETKLDPRRPGDTLAPEPFTRAVVDEILRAGMAHRVQIMSFDWRTLQLVQQMAPAIPTVYLTAQQRWLDNVGAAGPTASPWTAGFAWSEHRSVPRMIRAAGGRYWSVYHGDVDAAAVKEAHALGLKVLVWTVNDEPTMHRVLDLGIDGLITDRPDIAHRVIRARGLPIAP